MENVEIAIVGNKDSVQIFKSANCDVFSPEGENNTRILFGKLLKEYKLIMITDDYAKYVEDIIEDSLNSVFPVVTVIPSMQKDNSYAQNKIKEDIKRSLGINLKLE